MDIQVEYMPLSEIVQADTNPKDHDIGQIYQSIKRFGFTQPIMMNENTGKLLAGHGRLQTLQTMQQAGEKVPARIKEKDGEWLVPVLKGISFEDDMEAQAYLIDDNRLTELGGWNTPELLQAIEEIQESSPDLDDIGFTERELDMLYRDTEGPIEFDTDPVDTAVEFEENKYFDIMFEEEYQQQVFYEFLDYVKRKYPGETIAAKLNNHILDLLSDG